MCPVAAYQVLHYIGEDRGHNATASPSLGSTNFPENNNLNRRLVYVPFLNKRRDRSEVIFIAGKDKKKE